MNNRRSFLGGLAGIFGVGAVDAAAQSTIGTHPDAPNDASTMVSADTVLPDWIPNYGEPCILRATGQIVTAYNVVVRSDGDVEVAVHSHIGNAAWFARLADLSRLAGPPASVSPSLSKGIQHVTYR